MRVKLWGIRGSLPSPPSPDEIAKQAHALLERFFDLGHTSKAEISGFLAGLQAHELGGFGGNTPCIEVSSGKDSMIIDGGSGIRQLGYSLMNGPCGSGEGVVHLFFTHFHWDHLIGLPFFTPIFVPGNKIHMYAVQPELEEVIRTIFRKPYFPVPFEQLGAKFEFHRLEPRKDFRLGELTITPYQLDHPDPCWGYRVSATEAGSVKSYAHCVDTECKRVTREQLGPDLPLYQNADLMVFDAQYTLMESLERVNWGHAAATLGMDIALREGIKKVLFMHFDPAATDMRIAEGQLQAKRYYEARLKEAASKNEALKSFEWDFAREGMEIEI